jgi:hypothetical protein
MRTADIDKAILSCVGEHWKKVAMVVAKVAEGLEGSMPDANPRFELIASRIEALVEAGELFAQGDLKRWRFSEVRRSRQE